MIEIRFIDSNRAAMYFIALSETRDDLHHDLFVDKRTGKVRCDCEFARFNRLRPSLNALLDGQECDACKHAKALAAYCQELSNV